MLGIMNLFKRRNSKAPVGNTVTGISPKDGDVYEAKADLRIRYYIYYYTSYRSERKMYLPKGERVCVHKAESSNSSFLYCSSLRYEHIESLLPIRERISASYDGYSLYISLKQLENDFISIELHPISYVYDGIFEANGVNKIILNICNDENEWDSEFQHSLSARWQEPEQAYNAWAKDGIEFELGKVKFIKAAPDLYIANIIAKSTDDTAVEPSYTLRLEYLNACFESVRHFALENNAVVHIPKWAFPHDEDIWLKVTSIFRYEFIAHEIETVVFEH